MIRKTLIILSLIGMLLSVGAWGASYFRPLYRTNGVTLWSSNGRVVMTNFAPEVQATRFEWYRGFEGFETDWQPFHFRPADALCYWSLSISLWVPALMFGISLCYICRPLYYRRRRKRKKLGLCLKCGYDLRGSKERCPECGSTI